MKNLLITNKLVSATVLLSFTLLSTGFMPGSAAQADEGPALDFIPVVVRAESSADYGASGAHLVIAPVQPAAILAVLTDNNGAAVGSAIFEKVEQQLEQEDTGNTETSQSFSVSTPASQNEPNTDQIPGNGNAYGLGNGNGNGPGNNNGNGSSNENGNGNGPGNGPSVNANVGNGNVNANANANGNGVSVEIDEDGIGIQINLGNGNGQGLGLGLNKDEDNNNGLKNGNINNNPGNEND